MKIVSNKKFPYKIGERLWRSYYASGSNVIRIYGRRRLRLRKYTPCDTPCDFGYHCPYGMMRLRVSNRAGSWRHKVCIRTSEMYSDDEVKQAAINGYIVDRNGQRYRIEFDVEFTNYNVEVRYEDSTE